MPRLVEIGPVVLEKKSKIGKVYRRTDRQTDRLTDRQTDIRITIVCGGYKKPRFKPIYCKGDLGHVTDCVLNNIVTEL